MKAVITVDDIMALRPCPYAARDATRAAYVDSSFEQRHLETAVRYLEAL